MRTAGSTIGPEPGRCAGGKAIRQEFERLRNALGPGYTSAFCAFQAGRAVNDDPSIFRHGCQLPQLKAPTNSTSAALHPAEASSASTHIFLFLTSPTRPRVSVRVCQLFRVAHIALCSDSEGFPFSATLCMRCFAPRRRETPPASLSLVLPESRRSPPLPRAPGPQPPLP